MGVAVAEAVEVQRQSELVRLVEDAVDVVGYEADDFAGPENGLTDLFDRGVAWARTIVGAPPGDVGLVTLDADLHRPDTVIVRRQRAARQQRGDDHREAVVRLFVQRIDGEALHLVAREEARLAPT